MNQNRVGNGLLNDIGQDVEFTFDGKTYVGQRGDTLAAALMANDVTLLARSFKYHRPRGLMAAGVEESNALVTIGEGA
ncbi:MAG: 2Fe-2S iron-sulfur cluster-binding protein, partial [Alphaproteobacteria bacterium]